MSDHLPECPLLEPCDDEVPEHGYCSMQHGVFCIHCHQWCICHRLRACEQRVERRIDFMLAKANDYGERTGYAAALDAAREAVEVADTSALEALDPLDPRTIEVILAAIDRVVKPAAGGLYTGPPVPIGDGCVMPSTHALAAIDALRVQPAERTEDNLRGES